MAEDGLRPAAENPWYVLATIYGEHEWTEIEVDVQLAEQNARAWNAWMTQGMTSDDLAQRFGERALQFPGIGEWPEIRADIMKRFAARLPESPLPDPTEDVDVEETHFPSTVIFSQFLMLKRANFWDCTFEGYVDFGGAVFAEPMIFADTLFNGVVSFSGTDFRMFCEFRGIAFKNLVSFEDAHFHSNAHFRVTFESDVSFVGATVEGDLDLDSASFPKDASFRGSRIGRHAYFGQVAFHGSAFFAGTEIGGDAVLSECTCSDDLVFENARIGGGIHFREASCTGTAVFSQAEIGGEAHFTLAKFADDALFEGMKISGNAYFTEVEFAGRADFTDARFGSPANFRAAVFETAYPSLSGAILHQNIHFTARNVPHGEGGDESIRYWPADLKDPNASRNACGIIRHAVGQQGRPEDEHFFFRKEMWFAGRTNEPFLVRFPYLMFGWVSDFGYSIARPAWLLAVVWVVGFAAFVGYLVQAGGKTPLFTALGVSFSNVLPFFGTRSLFVGPEFFRGLPDALVLVAALQAVFGILLLFFLGLGLRTRFRLR